MLSGIGPQPGGWRAISRCFAQAIYKVSLHVAGSNPACFGVSPGFGLLGRDHKSVRSKLLAQAPQAIVAHSRENKGIRFTAITKCMCCACMQTGLDVVGLLDRGVVFAVAHVRGGGDYADLPGAWYQAGSGTAKKVGLQDYIDVATHLVAKR
jgi:hypothetical protein